MTGAELDQRFRRTELAAAVALAAALPVWVVFLVAGAGEQWWVYVTREDSPMAWSQSLLLFACGLLCLGCLGLAHLGHGPTRLERAGWLVLAGGFWFLMLDERFAAHERLRDMVLRPAGVGAPLPWMGPGDFLVLLFLLTGVALTPVWWRLLGGRPMARRTFLAGAALAAAAILADSVDFERISFAALAIEQFIEEIAEAAAMALMALGLLFRLNGYLRELMRQP